MASDPSFVEHALELVALVAPVEARRMFGGHGLYAGGVMFGLLDDGELFLKTDEESRARFVAAGCRRWTYVTKKVRMEETSYFRPPDEAHEDPEAMLPWARLALDAALRLRSARLAAATRRAATRSAAPAGAAQRQQGSRRKEVSRERAPLRKESSPARQAGPGTAARPTPSTRRSGTRPPTRTSTAGSTTSTRPRKAGPPARKPVRARSPARRGKR